MWWMDLQYWPGPDTGMIHRIKLNSEIYRSGTQVFQRLDTVSRITLGTVIEEEHFMFGEHAGETWVTYITRD